MLLSDTFSINKSKKVYYSVTVLIIASFLVAVNCINFPFFYINFLIYLNFYLKKEKNLLIFHGK